jgi:hypothetical protein
MPKSKERITLTINLDIYWKLTNFMNKKKIRHYNEGILELLRIAKEAKKGAKKDDGLDSASTTID